MASKRNRRRLRDNRQYRCGRCGAQAPWQNAANHGEGKCLPVNARKTKR